MRCLLLLLLALLPVTAAAWDKNGTVYTTDGTQDDFESALAHAGRANGDTIEIPDGTWNWEYRNMELDNSVRVRGAGNGQGAGDTEIIVDGTGSSSVFWRLITVDGEDPVRLQSMYFSRNHTGEGTHFVRADGTGNIAIENCTFDDIHTSGSGVLRFSGAVWGVVSNCSFGVNGKTTLWFFNGEKLRDGSNWNDNGDTTWLQPVAFGTEQAIHIEDCDFYSASGASRNGATDFYGAAQAVLRYNDWDNCSASSHGHGDGSGRSVGPRKIEWYGNVVRNSLGLNNSSVWHRNRGGPEIFYNNEVYDYEGNFHTLSWYLADDDHGRHGVFPTYGRDRWTVEDSGTTDAPTGQRTLVDATKSWAENEHVGKIAIIDIDSRYTKIPTEAFTISSIDNTTEEITFTTNHTFVEDDVVVVDEIANGGNLTYNTSSNTGSGIGNWFRSQETEQRGGMAFVHVVDADTIWLELTPGGTKVDLETLGSTAPEVRRIYGGGISSTDTAADTVDLYAAHDFSQDDMAVIFSQDADAPSPIEPNPNDGDNSWDTVFIDVVDADTIGFLDAPGGSRIDLTAAGAGGPAFVSGVGEYTNGFHKNPHGHFRMAISSNTPTTLTGQGGTINIWINHDWFLGNLSYEIVDMISAPGIPGGGQWRAVPGIGVFNETVGGYGESNPNAPTWTTFTTDFATDANRLVLFANDESDQLTNAGNDTSPGYEQFENLGDVVRFTTTGTLPTGLSVDTDYYVIEWDDDVANTWQIEVSATDGGLPVTLTGNGTGTHTVWAYQDPGIDGVYHWGTIDSTGGSLIEDLAFNIGVTDNRHGFQDTSATPGITSGTTLPTPVSGELLNSGFWKTDESTLYVARDTDEGGFGTPDAWVATWSEYTYPHPLVELSQAAIPGDATATTVNATTTNVGP